MRNRKQSASPIRVMASLVAASFCASGCGGEETGVPAGQPVARTTLTESAAAAGPDAAPKPIRTAVLSESYIVGDWCIVEMTLMRKTFRAGLVYRFLEQGRLFYHKKRNDSAWHEGTWEIEGDRLLIKSDGFDLFRPLSRIAPDEFVWDHKLVPVFHRGPCADPS